MKPFSAVGARLSAAIVFAAALQAQQPAADSEIVKDTNVAVPMRDGVVLRADVWRPHGTGPFPVLVYRTPYGKHQATAAFATARRAVVRGYAVVMQDVRGRYASDGEYVAYQQEGRDGYDTIEWAARQPWSNGDVGTFGLSYPGAVQWLAAIENPPHLRAMAPAMTFASPMQFWYSNGVWDGSWVSWIYHNIAPDRRKKLGMSPEAPWDSVKDRIRGTLPLLAMNEFERTTPWYYEWLRHPAFDPWWNWAELRGKYARTSAAVLNFSAWHDEAYGPHGATNNFMGLVASRARAPARTAMVIGPWSHGVPRVGRTIVGERQMTEAANIDYDGLVLGWLDMYLKRDAPGVMTKPVRVFVMGSNRWIDADAWPIPGTKYDTLYLGPDRALGGKPVNGSTTIVSDPAKPVINEFDGRAGAHDYRALAQRPDVLVFETAPRETDLTVVGAIKARVAISVDAPDTDLWVKVYDVAPDGTAFNLMSPGLDVVRASYRNGSPKRELLQPGRVYELRFDDLLTGNTFKRGHTLRIALMTSFAPDFSRNLHSGDLEAGSARSRLARITIHLGSSFVVLPVLPATAMLSADK